MKGKKGRKLFKKRFGRKQKVATLIAGICAVVIIAWVVLLVSIFREDKPGEENRKSSVKAGRGPWVLVEAYHADSKGDESRVFHCEYDEKGRLLSVIYDDEKKGIYSYSYYYDDGIPITRVDHATGKGNVTEEYLPDGRIRLQIVNESSDRYTHIETTQFDDQERAVVLTVEHESSASPHSVEVTRWSYDSYGHIVLEETQETVGGTTGEWVLKKTADYDDEGFAVKCYEVGADGRKGKVLVEVSYYSEGRKERSFISSESYYGNGSVLREFDSEGRVITESYKGGYEGGETSNRYRYESTDRGLFIEKKMSAKAYSEASTEKRTVEQEFDGSGRLLSEKETALGKLQYSYSVEFDRNGRIAKTSEIYLGINPVETLFFYDVNGNLTVKENERERYSYTYEKTGVSSAQAAENEKFYLYFPEDLPGILYWK